MNTLNVANVFAMISLFAFACAPASQAGDDTAASAIGSATTNDAVVDVIDVPAHVHPITRGNIDVLANASAIPEKERAIAFQASETPDLALRPVHVKSPSSLFGQARAWKITGHVFATFSAFSNDEADALTGHYVMSNASLVTPWERCDAPRSAYRDATVEEWFSSFDDRGLSDADRATLGTPHGATIRVHDLTCRGGESIEIVIVSKDDVILVRDGVAFAAHR